MTHVFHNEYPKHAPNMQNIHETRNDKKLILLKPSKEKCSIQPMLMWCVCEPFNEKKINLQNEEKFSPP
jgi:hypothetical protein